MAAREPLTENAAVSGSAPGGVRVSSEGPAWPFNADGRAFRLVSEALRIRLAYLFDPYLAIHTARIAPLPHQIDAVYGAMLPRHPLRFLLADDPGAGKTVMAGLLIKELIIRGDLNRCLIVAPGSLVEQWQDELAQKLGLTFDILTRAEITAAGAGNPSGNPFAERRRLIARLDMLSRSEDLQHLIKSAPEWDLVVCDEAHRMAASFFGDEVKLTRRYRLGQLLGAHTRHLLLMSATPHNGHEADFQLFMALIDADRFEGRFRDGVHKSDASDLMRRLTKEELLTFEGRPLFPPRRAYTAQYELSPAEAALYRDVTTYVREEMNRAERFASEDEKRRNNVGFALQILQRRLASSPAAIHESLRRRRERLEGRLAETRRLARGGDTQMGALIRPDPAPMPDLDPDDLEDATEAELEAVEEAVLDRATAARTVAELETEILTLEHLEAQARALRFSGADAKWRELNAILDHPLMTDPAGNRRKLIVFTEPRDTLDYLAAKIRTRLGRREAVVVIHGGITREDRRKAIEAFTHDKSVIVMIANDAAGEGVNLQRAHLMVNYDLPWNPNRIEQRFGRIHRIGQTEVCHLWNLVAADTREGQVYARLLEKLETARDALGGRVYDVLGQAFQSTDLRDLLVEAICYGERPEVKARLFEKVDAAIDQRRLLDLIDEKALVRNHLAASQVARIKADMERAEARRLQPHYIESFFREAFAHLGGQMHAREDGRWEITRVPAAIRERARAIDPVIGRTEPVLERYERVAFDKSKLDGPPESPSLAAYLCPDHPLLEATTDLVLERYRNLLKRGAVLVNEADASEDIRALFYLEHAVQDGRNVRPSGSDTVTPAGDRMVISQRLQFVEVGADGQLRDAGPAPYLDYRPLGDEGRAVLVDQLAAGWLARDLEAEVLAFASAHLAPAHVEEVKVRRLAEIAKVEAQVTARLKQEITHWDNRAQVLKDEERAGKTARAGSRLNAAQAEARANELEARLQRRLAELDRERQISALPPAVRGGALVVPGGLLRRLSAPVAAKPPQYSEDAASRAEVERLAMESVMAAEKVLGFEPRDVSAERIGYDIESRDPRGGPLRFIEVKGRIEGADTVTITRNEILTAINKPDAFILAIVSVESGFAHSPQYVRNPFRREPDFGATSVTYELAELLRAAEAPS